MIEFLPFSILWIILILLDLVISIRLWGMYRKDQDTLKIMVVIGLLITALSYIMASVGINSFPITYRIYSWSPLPILFVFLIILLNDRFKFSINFAFKIFLVIVGITMGLFIIPIPISSIPILIIGVLFGIIQAIFHYSKQFELSSVILMLSMPSYAICFFAIQLNLIELAIFAGFATKIFLILAFEVAKRQTGVNSSILVLKEQLDVAKNNFQKLEQKLILTKRLAELGELSTMVAHDLRNPLQSINNSIYLLKKINGKNEKILNIVKKIEDSVNYSDNIVKELLEYSSKMNLEFTETVPHTLINQALSGITISGEVELIDKTKNTPILKVDTNKIRRVCENLIVNALDAMNKKGRLTITSEEVNGTIELNFSDTGCGIPKENLKKIMTPFFTSKAKGIGLGLAICQRIIEAHNGKILVESRIDRGTTFTLKIPIMPKKQEKT